MECKFSAISFDFRSHSVILNALMLMTDTQNHAGRNLKTKLIHKMKCEFYIHVKVTFLKIAQ